MCDRWLRGCFLTRGLRVRLRQRNWRLDESFDRFLSFVIAPSGENFDLAGLGKISTRARIR